jgi:hypothetical protein
MIISINVNLSYLSLENMAKVEQFEKTIWFEAISKPSYGRK